MTSIPTSAPSETRWSCIYYRKIWRRSLCLYLFVFPCRHHFSGHIWLFAWLVPPDKLLGRGGGGGGGGGGGRRRGERVQSTQQMKDDVGEKK